MKKNLCELCGIFTGKIFKIYFSNVFSMENDFLDHAACTKFFSEPVQEPQDFWQAFPLMIDVGVPSKITLYYSADPGFHWNLSRVTDPSGSHYPSRVTDLSRVRYLSWESARNREIHIGV